MAITDKLTDIADAIRLKRDIVTPLSLEDMALQVSLIDGGGGGDSLKSYHGTFTGNGTTAQVVELPITPIAFIVRPVTYTTVSAKSCLASWISFRDYPLTSNSTNTPQVKTIVGRKSASSNNITWVSESVIDMFAEYGTNMLKLKSNNNTYPIAAVEYEIYAIGTED